MQTKWMRILWPSFLAAAAMEMLVFGLFDPHDLRLLGHNLVLTSEATYTVAFFAFWCVTIASSWLTFVLGMSSGELNTGSAENT